MKWIEAKVFFHSPERSFSIQIIADVFYDIGVKGVVIEGPDETPIDGWAPDIPVPSQRDAVIGYIPEDKFAARTCRQLERNLDQISVSHGIRTQIAYRAIDEEDWAESWKAFFWPQKISHRIVVKPTWRTYDAHPGDIVLLLDPGMAFGTGTHATTSLCVRLIESYLHKGDTVLDIGTGSGILLIAAAKLGAEKALGIDNDPVAIAVANENIERNRLAGDRFRAEIGDLAGGLSHRYHLVVANILSEVIVELLDQITSVLVPNGVFICSGIIEEKRQVVHDKMKRMGFKILAQSVEEGWVAIAGKLKPIPAAESKPLAL